MAGKLAHVCLGALFLMQGCGSDASASHQVVDAALDGVPADATPAAPDALARDAEDVAQADVLPDAAMPSPFPRRIVFLISGLGIYHPKFQMSFPGVVDDGREWQRDLTDPQVQWSPILQPFAALREHLVVIDGLTQHASLNPWVFSQSSAIDDNARLSLLTGVVAPKDAAGKPNPPLDATLAAALRPLQPTPLVLSQGLTSSLGQPRHFTTAAAKAALANEPALGPAVKSCVRALPTPGEMSLPWAQGALAFVSDVFRCHAAQVATVDLPQRAPPGFAGDLHQDCGDALTEQNHACFLAYNVATAELVASLAANLAATDEPGGSMLDNTLVVWMSAEGGPRHMAYPWNAVVLGGKNLGLRGGRYMRVAQDVPTEEGFGSVSSLRGAPHNRLLVSVARLLGVNLNHVGTTSFPQKALPPIDATGGLEALEP